MYVYIYMYPYCIPIILDDSPKPNHDSSDITMWGHDQIHPELQFATLL